MTIKSLSKKLLISFIYLIIIIYVLEVLLAFYFFNKPKKIQTLKDFRIEYAKKNNVFFDERDFLDVFKDYDNKIKPEFRFNLISQDLYREILKDLEIIPFKGPILNKSLLFLNEDGKFNVVLNDRFGFKNDDRAYDQKIDTMIFGDSFAEGLPQDTNNDTAGYLRNDYKINSLNYGIAGTSLLTYYAVFKEYAKYFKPKNIFLFYYEGNDLMDLDREKNNYHLKKYLKDNYSQNLFDNYDKVIESLNILEKKTLKIYNKEKNKKYLVKKKKIDLIDIAELQKLREILKIDFSRPKYDFELFENLLVKIQKETQVWNGKVNFVYIPSWGRYNSKYNFEGNNSKYAFEQKDKIKQILKNLNINLIDVDDLFEKEGNPSQFYNFNFYSHFTKKGYNLISKEIAKNVNKK